MDLRSANLFPQLAASPDHARALVATDGAAIAERVDSLESAVAFGEAMLAGHGLRVRPQFEATRARQEADKAVIDTQPMDERGRKRDYGSFDRIQPAHNDGYGFGDFAPEYMFLWCERPCAKGGGSFLVDGIKLLALLSAEDPEFGRFAWEVPIDHSEPNFPQGNLVPIARVVPGGRVQVRHHPYQAAAVGPDEAAHARFVAKWSQSVSDARDSGVRFRLAPGQLLCIDNYRMLHGREAYVDPNRKVVSIWAWTKASVAAPAGEVSIITPNVPQPV
jgi:hypothetical protein